MNDTALAHNKELLHALADLLTAAKGTVAEEPVAEFIARMTTPTVAQP